MVITCWFKSFKVLSTSMLSRPDSFTSNDCIKRESLRIPPDIPRKVQFPEVMYMVPLVFTKLTSISGLITSIPIKMLRCIFFYILHILYASFDTV